MKRMLTVAALLLAFCLLPVSIHADSAALHKGDTFTFGYYEQDNRTENGREPITWIVLSVDKSKNTAFVIAESALDCQIYHPRRTGVKWGDSFLRQWLNLTFAYSAFNDSELACIEKTTSNGVKDIVTLLDEKQIKTYKLSKDGCPVTPYAQARGADVADDNGLGCWWVRCSKTKASGQTKFVGRHGKVYWSNYTDTRDNAVRPAITVKMSALRAYQDQGDLWGHTANDWRIGYTNQKIATRSGPGLEFDEIHTYNLPKGTMVRILRSQTTNGTPWVEIEFVNDYRRYRVWTGLKRVDHGSLSGLPGDYRPMGTGRLHRATSGWYGPGEHYEIIYSEVPNGTYVEIMGVERGWYLIQYRDKYTTDNILRTWVPGDAVSLDDNFD